MTLVICEHDNTDLTAISANAFAAAGQLGDVTALVLGDNCHSVAEQAAAYMPVKQVILAESAQFKDGVSEAIAPTILSVIDKLQPRAIVAASSSFAKGLLPWLAAKLGVHPISDVIEIGADNHFKRPIYAGNAIAEIKSNQECNVFTIRATAFKAAAVTQDAAPIESITAQTASSNTSFVSRKHSTSARPDLTSAEIVVSGGRGVGSKENFALIEALADKLQAAVGASRAAVDAGFIANEFQVGQTGKIVAPKLYIAIGISGAIQHLAGMKDAAVIVAINKDADAPIFAIADYGLAGDLFDLVPELTAKITPKT